MRMALDLGLHRALEKLAEDGGKKRTEEEERNLGVFCPERAQDNTDPHKVISARIWPCLYWFDHQ